MKTESDELITIVKKKYAEAARSATKAAPLGCCGPAEPCCSTDPVTSNLYSPSDTDMLPDQAVQASLGCGNPTALAELEPGEVVLDLGSGGGIDVLLSARRVAPTGKAYGLDMTDEMLDLARRNQAAAGVSNVEFLKGRIEAIPLPDASVDVVISNCVINLSGDKEAVIREAYRVLRPGGRFAVSDIVVRGPIPDEIRRNMELWVGCVAGALDEEVLKHIMTDVGFTSVDVEPTRIYDAEELEALMASAGLELPSMAEVEGRLMAAFIRGLKG